ncbi:MAG: Fic family protein [Coriobacteriaceae bacterium]|jgi:Fic family protein|nr:Fic family protein [Coriobacteriaceae bacterium]
MFTPQAMTEERYYVSPKTQADVARAEALLIRMENKAGFSGIEFALSRTLARLEALSTIHIEGKNPSLESLLYLESFLDGYDGETEGKLERLDFFDFGGDGSKQVALEVLRYLQVLEYLYFEYDPSLPFTQKTLLDIHSLLFYGGHSEDYGVTFRKKEYALAKDTAASKVYRPPAPEALSDLLDDLCAFINAETYAPITQSAIAHFQFESIKPFKSGLDKTGRLMCHAIFRKRGLLKNVIAPIGLEPAIDTKSHAQSLLPYNFGLDVDATNRMLLIDRWIGFCAWSAEVAARVADVYLNAMLSVKEEWTRVFGKPNKGSAPEALLDILAGTPILTIKQAVALTGKSVTSVSEAFSRLEKVGIVSIMDNPGRSRIFVAQTALDLLDDLNRKINPSEPISRDSFIMKEH